MKKIFFIIAVAIATISFSASAQECAKAKTCNETSKCKQECVSSKDNCTSMTCCDELFKGITLTETQKNQFKELKNTCKTECAKAQACTKTKADCPKAQACTKGDKKACEASVKKILTSEQYAIFVKNAKAAKQSNATCTKRAPKCCK